MESSKMLLDWVLLCSFVVEMISAGVVDGTAEKKTKLCNKLRCEMRYKEV